MWDSGFLRVGEEKEVLRDRTSLIYEKDEAKLYISASISSMYYQLPVPIFDIDAAHHEKSNQLF